MHPSPLYATGLSPAALRRSTAISRHFFGHAATQRPHPLQQSSSIFGLAISTSKKQGAYYIPLRQLNQLLFQKKRTGFVAHPSWEIRIIGMFIHDIAGDRFKKRGNSRVRRTQLLLSKRRKHPPIPRASARKRRPT
jgi:hypothetical protein